MSEPSGKGPRVDGRWAVAFVAVGLLAVALSAAAYLELFPVAMNRVPQWDKGVHFTMAALLFFTLDRTLCRRALRVGRWPLPLAALVVLTVMGVEELSQGFSPLRTMSGFDYAADVLGVTFVALIRKRRTESTS